MFLYGNWLKLPLHTRATIAEKFGFKKVGSTHVQDNRIVSDGYRIEDIEKHLSLDAIKAITGSNSEDWAYQWEMFVQRIENPVEEIISEPIDNGKKDKKSGKK